MDCEGESCPAIFSLKKMMICNVLIKLSILGRDLLLKSFPGDRFLDCHGSRMNPASVFHRTSVRLVDDQ